MVPYMTEVDVHDPEDHGNGELDGEDGEEPLGGVHVSLYPLLYEVAVKTLHVLLRGSGELWVIEVSETHHEHVHCIFLV